MQHKTKRGFCMLLVAFVIIFSIPLNTFAGTNPVLAIQSKVASPGETVSVDVNISGMASNTKSFTSGSFAVEYDNTILDASASSVTNGTLLSGSPQVNKEDNGGKSQLIIAFTAGFDDDSQQIYLQDGKIVTISFTVKAGAKGIAELAVKQNGVQPLFQNVSATPTSLTVDTSNGAIYVRNPVQNVVINALKLQGAGKKVQFVNEVLSQVGRNVSASAIVTTAQSILAPEVIISNSDLLAALQKYESLSEQTRQKAEAAILNFPTISTSYSATNTAGFNSVAMAINYEVTGDIYDYTGFNIFATGIKEYLKLQPGYIAFDDATTESAIDLKSTSSNMYTQMFTDMVSSVETLALKGITDFDSFMQYAENMVNSKSVSEIAAFKAFLSQLCDGYDDGKLLSLSVSGQAISGFSPDIYSYNVTLPAGTTTFPTITADPKVDNPVTITTSGSISATTSGTAIVTVTAANGSQKVYTVVMSADAGTTISGSSVSLTIGKGLARPDKFAGAKRVRIPVSVDTTTAAIGFTGYSMDIEYNPSLFIPVGILAYNINNKDGIAIPTTLGAITIIDSTHAKVNMSWSGTLPAVAYSTSKGVLFKIIFEATSNFTSAVGQASISISNASYQLNNGNSNNISVSAGIIYFGMYGDVNEDGNINSTDAGQILRRSLGKNPNAVNSFKRELAADVNLDGNMNSTDAGQIKRYSLGKVPNSLQSSFGY